MISGEEGVFFHTIFRLAIYVCSSALLADVLTFFAPFMCCVGVGLFVLGV